MQKAADALTSGGDIFVKNDCEITVASDGTATYGVALKNSGVALMCDRGAWIKVADNQPATSSNYGVITLSYQYLTKTDLYARLNIDGNKIGQSNA